MPKKLRKMLGAADSPYILSLMRVIDTQSKATIASWCMNYCEEHILPIFEKHCPDDDRPRTAIAASRFSAAIRRKSSANALTMI